jgi:predicted phosphodiesterase
MTKIRLGIVGDTQRVLLVERFAFFRESNDAERSRLAAALLAEQLDAVIHLGDVVGCVSSARHWKRFDRDYPPDVRSQKPFLVCRGNHDVGGLLWGSSRRFDERFPGVVAGLRLVDIGNVRAILIDTNADSVGSDRWAKQKQDFAHAVRNADENPTIDHVFVFGHHPPFTNGRWHPPSLEAREAFVDAFLSGRKTRAFFSGHVHGYERFTQNGRRFIVTGGGGGPRFSHLNGADQRLTSDIDLTDPHPFHYVVLEATPGSLCAFVLGFDTIDQELRRIDEWSWPI